MPRLPARTPRLRAFSLLAASLIGCGGSENAVAPPAAGDSAPGAPAAGAAAPPVAAVERPEAVRKPRITDRYAFEKKLCPEDTDSAATVVIEGVTPIQGLHDYLVSEFRLAADRYRLEATAVSRKFNETSRKRTEDTLKEQGAHVGMWFTYEAKRPELGSTMVNVATLDAAAEATGRAAYHVFPVPNLDRMAKDLRGLRVVDVDDEARVLTVRSELPDLLPERRIEALAEQYPADKIVWLTVRFPDGAEPGVTRADLGDWVLDRIGHAATEADPLRRFEVVKHRWASTPTVDYSAGPRGGVLLFAVAPVDDVTAYAEGLQLGGAPGVHPAGKAVDVRVLTPPNLPELAAAARKRRDGRQAALVRQKLDRESGKVPREGETTFEWAATVLGDSE